jgi:hypothetical protein
MKIRELLSQNIEEVLWVHPVGLDKTTINEII